MTLLVACAGPSATDPSADPADPADPAVPHVLVIGVDGMRPDALRVADAPRMQALVDDGVGSWSGHVQTDALPISGPGWATLLTGHDPADHGVEGNDDLLDRPAALPTVPERTRRAGLPTAVIIDWVGILALVTHAGYDTLTIGTDEEVGIELEARIRAGGDRLIWTHFNDVDAAGHASGFSPDNPAYRAEIADVDRQIGPALDALADRPDDERWLVALVTDHGGFGTSHSDPVPECLIVPMAVWAEDLPPRQVADAHQHDLAATLLDWLGLDVEPGGPGASWL